MTPPRRPGLAPQSDDSSDKRNTASAENARPPPPPDDDLDVYAPLPDLDSNLETLGTLEPVPVPRKLTPVISAEAPAAADLGADHPRLVDNRPGDRTPAKAEKGDRSPARSDRKPEDSSGKLISVEAGMEMPMPAVGSGGLDGRRKLPLGEMLLAAGLIREDQLDMALAEQRRTRNLLGEVLISLGFISEQTVSETVSAQTGIPYVRVTQDPVAPELLKMVPEDVCRRHRLVPLGAEGSVLRLAMANPFDVVALDYIRTTTGLIPFPSIAPWGDILKTIERHFSVSESFDDAFEALIASAEAKADDMDVEEVGGPLVELVDQIIVRAVEERGTDIHIEPEENIVRIRYRIDGVLVPGPMVPKKLQFAIAARIKVMGGLNVAENRVPQDGRIRFSIKGRNVDLRVSTFLCNYGENIVLRVLDKASVVLSLERLLLPDDLARMERIIQKPHGIVVVTGPTGSGKTTTLYASLTRLNTIDVNIMTIEDPIEYELNLIRQSQVNVKAGITFASGLRALLRQDPDIILIGEMRDTETAQMASRAAMTGHLVFSTLHTNTAVGSIGRLVDMEVDPLIVSDTIICAIGQRLARTACNDCRAIVPAPDIRRKELEEAAEREGIDWDGNVAEARGCAECKMRGYRGRAALYEFFEMTHAAQGLILKKQYGQELADLARAEGMRSMYDDGLRRVLMRHLTLDELDSVIDRELRAEMEG
jgi:type IV pilus assembly protein PilB